MKDFEWQTDEEDLWKDEGGTASETAPVRRRRWWPGALAVLLVVLLAGGVLYRQVNRRVEEAVSVVEGDVEAAFGVLHSAVERRDRELLVSVISGRDSRWTSTQKQLLEAGLLFDRAPFGLWLQAAEPRIISVELAPNLAQAELVVEQVYAIETEYGVTETVRLQQTAVFRLGERRWLFAPPDEEFWGDYTLMEGQYVTLEVPQRDHDIGVRLAADLDRVVEEMCRTLEGIDCPAESNLFVRLETDPESWLEATKTPNRLSASHLLALPAPSLLGLPVDEAGYQALWRGYAEHVLSPYIAERVSYDCCNSHFLFYEALLRQELSELGIRPWPLGPAEYERLAHGPLELGELSDLWFTSLTEATDRDRQYVMAVIAFLLEEGIGSEPARLQRSLDTRQSYWSWVQSEFSMLTTPQPSNIVLSRRWLQFVNGQTLSAQRPPPIPLPDQDIQLLCGTDMSLGLYRYELATDRWQRELDGRAFISLWSLPDDSSVILEEPYSTDLVNQGKRIVQWQNGREMVVYEGPMEAGLLGGFHGEYPGGDFLRVYGFLDNSGLPSFFYLDLGDCDESGCAQHSLTGLPIWSPDGQHSVVWEFMDPEWTLVVSDSEGRPITRLSEAGFSPFWLDNLTFGYLYPFANGGQEVRLVSLDDVTMPRTVMSLEDLRQAIPETERQEGLSLAYVAAAPDDPDTLYVAVNSLNDVREKVYLFAYTLPELTAVPPTSSFMESVGEVTLLVEADDSFATFPPLQFSPDGRWLTVVTSGWRHPARLFFLYDRTTGETQQFESSPSFPYYDWSADSQWLLRVEEGYMSLTAPAHDYHRLLFYEQPQCGSPAWVNR